MVAINAACPDCGDVVLGPEDVTLMVCNNKSNCTYYRFMCPKCLTMIRKFADSYVQAQLKKADVKPVLWKVPAEVLEKHTGPPISHDDLLDFGLALYMSDIHPLEGM